MRRAAVIALIPIGLAAGWLYGRRSPAPAAPPPAAARVERPAAPRPPPLAVDVRAQVAEIIARDRSGLRSEADVVAYLDRLEAQARRNRVATALEVEPGFAAIDSLASILPPEQVMEMRAGFGQRMAAVGEAAETPAAPDPIERPADRAQELAEAAGALDPAPRATLGR